MSRKKRQEDEDVEDVLVVKKSSGHAALRPVSFGRLSHEAQTTLLALEEASEHLRLIQRDRHRLVDQARAEGVSWFHIGLSMGITGEAARKRYQFGQEEPWDGS